MTERRFDTRVARWCLYVGLLAMALSFVIIGLTGVFESDWIGVSILLMAVGWIALLLAVVFGVVAFMRWLFADDE